MQFSPMTEDERMARALAQMNVANASSFNGPDMPGMITQTALTPEELKAQAIKDATASTAGREAKLKAQQAYVDQLRGSKVGKGRQVGDLFIAASPLEGLGTLAKQAAGLYGQSKLNERYSGLDKAKSKSAEAEQDLVDYRAGEDRAFTNEQRLAKDATAAAAAEKLKTERQGETEVGQFVDMSVPAESRLPFQAVKLPSGTWIDVDTRQPIPRSSVPYSDTPDSKGSGGGGGALSMNEPNRYIDPFTGEEKMLAFRKNDGRLWDVMDQRFLDKDELAGLSPEKEMTESQREKAVVTFIKNNGDTFRLMDDVVRAENTWRENGLKPGENPFNWLTKQVNALGDVARLVDDFGKEGAPSQDNFAAGQTVINTISRLRAGLSQTVNEVERIRTETGQDPLASPEVFMKYWGRLKDKLADDIAMVNRTASPRTVQAYKRWESQKGADDTILPETMRPGGGQMSRNNQKTFVEPPGWAGWDEGKRERYMAYLEKS